MNGILLDENNKLMIQNGSLVVGDSTLQNQKLLLVASKGELKENPTSGVGIVRYLETSDSDELAREIRRVFSQDGMTVNQIKINIPNIDIDANY